MVFMRIWYSGCVRAYFSPTASLVAAMATPERESTTRARSVPHVEILPKVCPVRWHLKFISISRMGWKLFVCARVRSLIFWS